MTDKDRIMHQAQCPYCHTDSDGYITPLERNSHAYISFGMFGPMISLRANGWHGNCQINYCPMCGRRLRDEK